MWNIKYDMEALDGKPGLLLVLLGPSGDAEVVEPESCRSWLTKQNLFDWEINNISRENNNQSTCHIIFYD